jgi:UDP-galactopyranose mutase
MTNKRAIQIDGKSKAKPFSQPSANGRNGAQAPRGSTSISELAWASASTPMSVPDLICFSHLRWDFVYQRPQHLLNRCAADRRVFFVEEPVFNDGPQRLEICPRDCGVWVVVPHLPDGLREEEIVTAQQTLLIDELILDHQVNEYILWYYTPMALPLSRHLEPLAVVYDCMDELSGFKHAPAKIKTLEQELLDRADLVFTGGVSLYEAKRHLHPNIHPFPSSIDAAHFGQARQFQNDPPDQSAITFPRIGFCGVIDERMDIELIREVATARPDWQLIMLGPVVKIDPAELPQGENIHYLGSKRYEDLPAYMAGWDIAMLPFAHNDSTRFISPTKTPEYLAAGLPAISTSIRDVVRPYGQMGLVKIADSANEFIAAAASLLGQGFDRKTWLRRVNEVLALNSWDRTWARMWQMINHVVSSRYPALPAPAAHAATNEKMQKAMMSPTVGD